MTHIISCKYIKNVTVEKDERFLQIILVTPFYTQQYYRKAWPKLGRRLDRQRWPNTYSRNSFNLFLINNLTETVAHI